MSVEPRRTAKRLPIACELSEVAQRSRREEISSKLFGGGEDVRELEDGYEFVFPGGAEWIERLTRFVASAPLRAGPGTGLAEDAGTGRDQGVPRGALLGFREAAYLHVVQ